MSDAVQTSGNQSADEEHSPSLVQTSLFFNRFAVWVFVAMLVLSVWFRLLPLMVVSTFLLLLSFVTTLWKRKALTKVVPTMKLSRSRIFSDETFSVQASLLNDKWLPLVWVEWECPQHREVIWGDDRRDRYIVRFLWLLWYQRIEWTMEGKALARGVYQLGEVTLRSGDGFRFSETERTEQLDELLYVYPKLVPVTTMDISPSFSWGAAGKRGGFLEDPLLVSGVRNYEAGDEWRKLNWKAAARTGALKTNVHEPVVNRELMIWIDVDGFAVNEHAYEDPIEQKAYAEEKKKEFEHFLSMIASVVVSFHDQGIKIGYASNAIDHFGREQTSIQPSADLTPVLDQFALLTAKRPRRKHANLTALVKEGRIKCPLFIFCKTIGKENYDWIQSFKQKMPEVRSYYNAEDAFSVKLAAVAKPLMSFSSSSMSS